jgi:hypothetical protein
VALSSFQTSFRPEGHPCSPASEDDNVSLIGTEITADPFLNWPVVACNPLSVPQTQSKEECLILLARMLLSVHDFSKFDSIVSTVDSRLN